MIKKIISFSLWGDNPKYTIGAVKNAVIAKDIYPDWTCRYYVGSDVPEYILENLKEHYNVEVVEMLGEPNLGGVATGWNGMFWRFFAADGDDIVISRDTDSRLGYREKAAVDEWLESDKDFHIMRDHPYHATEILGGMWGVRNGLLKGIGKMINEYSRGEYDDKYQVDQNFLREKIYPIVKGHATVHDEFFEYKPFPNQFPRFPADFVGQVFDSNDKPEF